MEIEKLEHVAVRVQDLSESEHFYSEILGLRIGPRPPFPFPGAWLYAGEIPIIHLIGGRPAEGATTGAIDHVALVASDPEAFIARCDDKGITYDEREVPGFGLRQVFVLDPNGVLIEVNFPTG